MNQPTVAVVGAGVSGLTAAHLMRDSHRVTLFEADQRLGGHAHTHDVPASDGSTLRVDSGFIVMNDRTYPHLLRLFAELGVETRPTEMSMGISCDECGLAYVGGRGAGGIFAQRRRILDRTFWRLLLQVPRFHRRARALMAGDEDPTWGEFLASGGFTEHFVRHFAMPLVSVVWSCGDQDAAHYPARHLFAFLEHHGMLSVKGSPTWRTVVGGSRTYVDRLAAGLADVRTGSAVTGVTRHDHGVEVSTADGTTQIFDRVVLATHADQALTVLHDASPQEKEALAAITYSRNETLLHHDAALLPAPAARGSWNHRMASCRGGAEQVVVSYWMNRLQGLDDAREHVVSLNAADRVDPAAVEASMVYEHPVFTPEAVRAAAVLRAAGGPRLAFAGAHLGWGFHEDGCRSAVEAVASFGVTW